MVNGGSGKEEESNKIRKRWTVIEEEEGKERSGGEAVSGLEKEDGV